MYGIVNKAIKGLITENYGEEIWQKIKSTSGVNIDVFLSNEPYDDAITYKLAQSASDVLKIPLSVVLNLLGEYWILKTGMENYGSLMEAGGDSVEEFLVNLPNFHSRVMLMFPDLVPPEFRISDKTDHSVYVHYYSDRHGLAEFVRGLLVGIGKMYNEDPVITMISSREEGDDHEVFKVEWK